MAEADLRPNEIQDLAEQVGALTALTTGTGLDLIFHLRIEVHGGGAIPTGLRTKLNDLLKQVKVGLTVR